MNTNTRARQAVTAVRRHPLRAAAICVPLLAASVFTSQSMASATPTPTLAVSSSALSAAPAPHVLTVDNQMNWKPVTANHGATVPQNIQNIDGCDADYGLPGDCVPRTIPGSTPQAKCAWLRSNGFVKLKVYGTNRQHLPENAAGYVCA
jgi:hypothetical protein